MLVDELLDLFKREGLDKYHFRLEGAGCRHWVWCFADMLRRKGLLKEQQQWHDAVEGLKTVWGADGKRAEQKWQVDMHAKQGTFY